METILSEFVKQAIIYMEENTSKVKKCFEELTEEDVWQRPNKASNSVGNLVLHLCGNITQYILSSLGKTEDKRERDKEFSIEGGYTKEELMEKLEATIAQSISVIKTAKQPEVLLKRSVQGFEHSAIAIIMHVVEHYSYHTGQIVFWTKLLKNQDLGFYRHVDLNQKNSF